MNGFGSAGERIITSLMTVQAGWQTFHPFVSIGMIRPYLVDWRKGLEFPQFQANHFGRPIGRQKVAVIRFGPLAIELEFPYWTNEYLQKPSDLSNELIPNCTGIC
jgi:hypothetical protein